MFTCTTRELAEFSSVNRVTQINEYETIQLRSNVYVQHIYIYIHKCIYFAKASYHFGKYLVTLNYMLMVMMISNV